MTTLSDLLIQGLIIHIITNTCNISNKRSQFFGRAPPASAAASVCGSATTPSQLPGDRAGGRSASARRRAYGPESADVGTMATKLRVPTPPWAPLRSKPMKVLRLPSGSSGTCGDGRNVASSTWCGRIRSSKLPQAGRPSICFNRSVASTGSLQTYSPGAMSSLRGKMFHPSFSQGQINLV